MLYIPVKAKDLPIGAFSHSPTIKYHGEKIELLEKFGHTMSDGKVEYLAFTMFGNFNQWVPENEICMVKI